LRSHPANDGRPGRAKKDLLMEVSKTLSVKQLVCLFSFLPG
jgi:hypothetical protein